MKASMLRALVGLALASLAFVAFAFTSADALRAADAESKVAVIPLLWRGSTMSPNPPTAAPTDPLYDVCGAPDDALVTVATRNGSRQLRGEPSFAADELAFTMRAAGVPYVWPRAWTIKGKALDPNAVADSLKTFVAKWKVLGERRCGVSRLATRDGTEVISLVIVDALADVSRTPTLTRVGEWVTLKGKMVTEAADAKVVLLGPRGRPKTVLASLSDGEIRATFMVDQPGEWLVQVLATVSTGPRPVLELQIHAGSPPPLRFAEAPAPGEADAPPNATDEVALFAMVNAARKSETRSPLMRDSSLDTIAREHSAKMKKASLVGHDVGDGDPGQRLRDAGITSNITGENVAGASSLVRAHRALWLSPSHRGNLLDDRYTRMGIGVVTGDDGRVYVTQLFAD